MCAPVDQAVWSDIRTDCILIRNDCRKRVGLSRKKLKSDRGKKYNHALEDNPRFFHVGSRLRLECEQWQHPHERRRSGQCLKPADLGSSNTKRERAKDTIRAHDVFPRLPVASRSLGRPPMSPKSTTWWASLSALATMMPGLLGYRALSPAEARVLERCCIHRFSGDVAARVGVFIATDSIPPIAPAPGCLPRARL